MRKIFLSASIFLLLAGCSTPIDLKKTEKIPQKQFNPSSVTQELQTTAQPNIPMENDHEVSFLLSEQEVENSWGVPERIIDQLAKSYDFSFKKGKEIDFPLLQPVNFNPFHEEKNVINVYTGAGHSLNL